MIVVMLTLFALVVVGFVAGKLGYLGGDFDRQLSRLVINITCPALILSSAMTGELPDRRYILPLLLISVLTYLLLSVAGFLLPRYLVRDRAVQGAVGFALIFGNVGFMGYPVVASIFGHEAVFYAAVLNVVNTFAVFTIGTILITGTSSDQKRFEKKVLYSTPMLAAYLTMGIVALRIDNIPAAISQPLTMLGNITVPAALLIVGSSMSQLSLRSMLGNATVYVTTLRTARCRAFRHAVSRFRAVRGQHQHPRHRDARCHLRHHPLSEIREGHHHDHRRHLCHDPRLDGIHPPPRHPAVLGH